LTVFAALTVTFFTPELIPKGREIKREENYKKILLIDLKLHDNL
jgi:hypothetical protein